MELVGSACPVCGEEKEDIEHYEFGCSKAEELRSGKQLLEKRGESKSAGKSCS